MFVQTPRMCSTRGDPECDLQTVGEKRVRASTDSSMVTNVPLCWGLLIAGKAVCAWRGRGYVGISVPSSKFDCKPETALEKAKSSIEKENPGIM